MQVRNEAAIRAGYQRFKDQKQAAEVSAAAQKHGLRTDALQTFVDAVLNRMIFDGERLTELLVRPHHQQFCCRNPSVACRPR